MFYPLIIFLSFSTEIICKTFRIRENKDRITEEDIKTANEKLAEMSSHKPSANEISEEKLLAYKTHYGLSVRETDVLAHILKDRSINEIAEELFISPSTVKFHVANLLKKTGAGSQRRLKQIVSEYDRFLGESQNKKADNE